MQSNYKSAKTGIIMAISGEYMKLWLEEHSKKVERRKNPDKTNLGADLQKISQDYDKKREDAATGQINGF